MIQKRPVASDKRRLKNMIIAAVILFVLIVTTIVTNILVGFIGGEDEEESTLPVVDTALGESVYAGRPIAYKKFSSSQIQEVTVKYYEDNKDEGPVVRYYTVKRPSELDEFEFYYTDTNGVSKVYRPEMFYKDGTSYTDFYSTENDGYNIYRISYLLSAVSVLYFGDKISLPENTAERENMLERYGLSTEEKQSILVRYINEKREEVQHLIDIGDKTIDGMGYYFTVSSPVMVEGEDGKMEEIYVPRDYIYCSSTTGFDYALNGFTSFLHSRLTAQGLKGDSTYEPYFTQDYKQWKNIIHRDKNNKDDKTSYGNKVIVSGAEEEFVYMDYSDIFGTDLKYENSGRYYQEGQFTVKLERDSAKQSKLIKVLLGKPVGEFDSPIEVTLPGESNWVMMDARYKYTIKEIEAILTEDGEDITARGTSVGDARFIKVVYDYEYEYAPIKNPEHFVLDKDVKGVIDLDKMNSENIPESMKKMMQTLKGLKIGKLSEQGLTDEQIASITGVIVDYAKPTYDEDGKLLTKGTADEYEVSYVITDIDSIWETDEKGNITKQITNIDEKTVDKTAVNFRYALMHGDEVLSTEKRTVWLGSIGEDAGLDYQIKKQLIGKGLGEQSIKVKDSVYREWITDYRTYTIDAIEYFIEQKLVVSFEFVNASGRDPFYSESLFKNTLPSGDKNRIYSLDSAASEYVVRLLGGISLESNSATSEGLKGEETVAVGLTPQNLEKYGLYANTIYYEIPRGIEPDKKTDGDYVFNSSLGFTLYISDLQADGKRYVGSDMYDIIVKIDGSKFAFLDKSFVDFWAREALASVSYEEISEVDFNFNMSDLKGSYRFEIQHKTYYIYGDQLLPYEPEEGGQAFDQIRILARAFNLEASTDTLYKKVLKEQGGSTLMLSGLYRRVLGTAGTPMFGNDTYDGMNFKTLLSVIFNTYYTGTISEEDQAKVKDMINDPDDPLKPIMEMSFKIGRDGSEWYANTYKYSFYRIDERRIMVSMHTIGNEDESVSDFYISPLAFKKIANGFVALLNGQPVIQDESFAD